MRREVAPFTGAWIETQLGSVFCSIRNVAPFTGAWIETTIDARIKAVYELSHPSRVRGLKQLDAFRASEEKLGRTLHGCVD